MGRPEVHATQIGARLWLVALLGEHDLSTAPDVRYGLREPLDSEASAIVDLTDADFIDSGILAELIMARRRAEASPHGSLVLIVPPESAAAELLDIVDADRRLFPTFDSRDAAIGSFGLDPAKIVDI